MSFTISALDNEFAAATGTNVGTSESRSRFDNPPAGSKDLVITTQEGDDDPRLFAIGDTYDIAWGGQAGGGTIIGAVVVRSDPSPAGEGTGIVVFDGVDENGEPAQIIWTPGFDLERWYSDNYNPSAEPEFYTQDMNASYDHRFVCFASETRIRTPEGSKAAGAFQCGDLVSTKDDGDVAVVWVGHRICAAEGPNAPVVFGQGALGNTAPVRLSQQHRVLVQSPYVHYYFGVEEAFVPAKACVNDADIRIIPQARICYVHLLLEKHHVVWAEGMECESLFLGDQAMKVLYSLPECQNMQHSMNRSVEQAMTARPVLKLKEAQLLMQHERVESVARDYQYAEMNFGPLSQGL